MRRLILSALLLTAAVPAFAQVPPPDVRADRYDGDRRDGERRDGDRRDGERRDGGQGGDQRDFRNGDNRDFRGDNRDFRGDNRDPRGGERDFRGGERRDFHDDRRDFRHDERRGFRDDRRDYRQDERFARFHADPFFYPRGYGYRYYGPGVRLPGVFFGSRYFIADPGFYRLPPAYAGTRWIRVGPDALLIRVYDGIVVRAIRGLFY